MFGSVYNLIFMNHFNDYNTYLFISTQKYNML